jgi:hypothetical protein
LLWDAGFAMARGDLRPYVTVTDLANCSYQEIRGVVMPGRAITGGIEFRVNLR